ncbi:MAG: hypothetical protein H0W83_13940 [Planctomycetes bacterium]|nr:hypothetical protein [Planctomycetota bacterium]
MISHQQPVQDNTPPVAITITEPVVEDHETTTDTDLSSINEINVPDMQRIGDGQPLVSSDSEIPSGFDASGLLTVEGNLADGSAPTQDPVSPE